MQENLREREGERERERERMISTMYTKLTTNYLRIMLKLTEVEPTITFHFHGWISTNVS